MKNNNLKMALILEPLNGIEHVAHIQHRIRLSFFSLLINILQALLLTFCTDLIFFPTFHHKAVAVRHKTVLKVHHFDVLAFI